MREEEIVRLLLHQPEKGTAAAMEQYGQKVKWMVCQVLRNVRPEDVEECVADVFVKLWQDIPAFDEKKGSLTAWIYGVARHTAIDRLRRLTGKETVPLSDFEEKEGLGVSPDFSDETVKKENAAVIREAVHGMKQPDRNIFLLRYFYFLTVREIAQRLDLTEKQVENRLRRGRARLRKELTERGVILE